MTGGKAAEIPSPPYHRVLLLVIAAFTLNFGVDFWSCSHKGNCAFGGDFRPFYIASLFAVSGHADAVYNIGEMRSGLAASTPTHPYVNPPVSLLLFYPLGLLTYGKAMLLWLGAQLMVLAAALRTDYVRRLTENRTDLPLLLFPFVLLNAVYGQTGMLTAALFLLTLAWRTSRPTLSGLMLAMLSFKPQAGLVLPVLLLKERNWRVLAAAALCTGMFCALSMLLWGIAPWRNYVRVLGLFETMITHASHSILLISASPYMGLRLIGINNSLAMALQCAISLLALILLWRWLTPSLEEPLKLLLLATANFLIAPYGFCYDMVILAPACLFLLRRLEADDTPAQERATAFMLALLPILVIRFQIEHIPYSVVTLLMAFLAGCRAAGRATDGKALEA